MLYLHIPFCKQRCIYCDFYSTTEREELRARFVDTLCEEMGSRRTYIASQSLGSIYMGGGTPSLLSLNELGLIMDCIGRYYTLVDNAEITIEANPDDVTPEWVRGIKQLGINRVSLGVQTFDDELLHLIRRRHTASQARSAVNLLAEEGLDNISIDLIYGLPRQDLSQFARDLKEAFALPIKHLSSYALTVEEQTPLGRLVHEGRLAETNEELYLQSYELLLDTASKAGFEHYEISNFAAPGFRARHNSGYWDGTPYLGCGPGAHSYNGRERRYNKPDLTAYIEHPGHPPYEAEVLTSSEKFDERIFTSLRTHEGLSLLSLRQSFGDRWVKEMLESAAPHIAGGCLTIDHGRLRLTRKGLFVSDNIISDLMRAED